jgi:hypothetical protein
LALYRELGDKRGIAWALHGLGWAAKQQNDNSRAAALTTESLTLRQELGDQRGIAVSLHNLAWMVFDPEDAVQAGALFAESLALNWELGNKSLLAGCLVGLARVAGVQQQPERAARLLGTSEALRMALGESMWPSALMQYERAAAIARAALGEEAFATAWAEGQGMPLEQAITEALDTTQHSNDIA